VHDFGKYYVALIPAGNKYVLRISENLAVEKGVDKARLIQTDGDLEFHYVAGKSRNARVEFEAEGIRTTLVQADGIPFQKLVITAGGNNDIVAVIIPKPRFGRFYQDYYRYQSYWTSLQRLTKLSRRLQSSFASTEQRNETPPKRPSKRTTKCITVIYFVSPKNGKPPNAITVTDLADFYICPRRFLYRKILGQKLNYAMINGARAHAKKYNEHKERAEKKIPIGMAVDLAMAGEELIGREVEIYGNGLYGVMDEVRLYPEEAVIIDFKASLSERGKVQVFAYASALRSLGVKNITVQIVRTGDDELLWEKNFDENDFWFVESLKQRFHATVRAGVFPKKEDPNVCEGCPFRKICNG